VARFEPGTVLLVEGQKSARLYILIDGSVEVSRGDFQINVVSDRGATFGEMSALLDSPHMATVRAFTSCTAYAVEGADAFLQSHKEIAYLLAKVLAQRLNGVTTYLVDLKRQFEDHTSHLGMVDEILETLLHQQRHNFTPGSDRDPG
jgi:CRP-like cAMP-binding protein